jgi:exodeoxyribonuclease VIII
MHVSLDVETLDNTPISALLSVGAVAFDPGKDIALGESVFYENVILDAKAGRVSHDTFQWWMEQSESARGALFNPAPKKIEEVLQYFSAWWLKVRGKYLWAHATFDIPILAYHYARLGKTAPWDYRNCRDLRTLEDLSGCMRVRSEQPHNALADARAQAEQVVMGLRLIKKAA